VTPTSQAVGLFQRAKQPADMHLVSGVDHFMFADDTGIVRQVLTDWLARRFPAAAAVAKPAAKKAAKAAAKAADAKVSAKASKAAAKAAKPRKAGKAKSPKAAAKPAKAGKSRKKAG
jgi:hypothetical protein